MEEELLRWLLASNSSLTGYNPAIQGVTTGNGIIDRLLGFLLKGQLGARPAPGSAQSVADAYFIRDRSVDFIQAQAGSFAGNLMFERMGLDRSNPIFNMLAGTFSDPDGFVAKNILSKTVGGNPMAAQMGMYAHLTGQAMQTFGGKRNITLEETNKMMESLYRGKRSGDALNQFTGGFYDVTPFTKEEFDAATAVNREKLTKAKVPQAGADAMLKDPTQALSNITQIQDFQTRLAAVTERKNKELAASTAFTNTLSTKSAELASTSAATAATAATASPFLDFAPLRKLGTTSFAKLEAKAQNDIVAKMTEGQHTAIRSVNLRSLFDNKTPSKDTADERTQAVALLAAQQKNETGTLASAEAGLRELGIKPDEFSNLLKDKAFIALSPDEKLDKLANTQALFEPGSAFKLQAADPKNRVKLVNALTPPPAAPAAAAAAAAAVPVPAPQTLTPTLFLNAIKRNDTENDLAALSFAPRTTADALATPKQKLETQLAKEGLDLKKLLAMGSLEGKSFADQQAAVRNVTTDSSGKIIGVAGETLQTRATNANNATDLEPLVKYLQAIANSTKATADGLEKGEKGSTTDYNAIHSGFESITTALKALKVDDDKIAEIKSSFDANDLKTVNEKITQVLPAEAADTLKAQVKNVKDLENGRLRGINYEKSAGFRLEDITGGFTRAAQLSLLGNRSDPQKALDEFLNGKNPSAIYAMDAARSLFGTDKSGAELMTLQNRLFGTASVDLLNEKSAGHAEKTMRSIKARARLDGISESSVLQLIDLSRDTGVNSGDVFDSVGGDTYTAIALNALQRAGIFKETVGSDETRRRGGPLKIAQREVQNQIEGLGQESTQQTAALLSYFTTKKAVTKAGTETHTNATESLDLLNKYVTSGDKSTLGHIAMTKSLVALTGSDPNVYRVMNDESLRGFGLRDFGKDLVNFGPTAVIDELFNTQMTRSTPNGKDLTAIFKEELLNMKEGDSIQMVGAKAQERFQAQNTKNKVGTNYFAVVGRLNQLAPQVMSDYTRIGRQKKVSEDLQQSLTIALEASAAREFGFVNAPIAENIFQAIISGDLKKNGLLDAIKPLQDLYGKKDGEVRNKLGGSAEQVQTAITALTAVAGPATVETEDAFVKNLLNVATNYAAGASNPLTVSDGAKGNLPGKAALETVFNAPVLRALYKISPQAADFEKDSAGLMAATNKEEFLRENKFEEKYGIEKHADFVNVTAARAAFYNNSEFNSMRKRGVPEIKAIQAMGAAFMATDLQAQAKKADTSDQVSKEFNALVTTEQKTQEKTSRLDAESFSPAAIEALVAKADEVSQENSAFNLIRMGAKGVSLDIKGFRELSTADQGTFKAKMMDSFAYTNLAKLTMTAFDQGGPAGGNSKKPEKDPQTAIFETLIAELKLFIAAINTSGDKVSNSLAKFLQ